MHQYLQKESKIHMFVLEGLSAVGLSDLPQNPNLQQSIPIELLLISGAQNYLKSFILKIY